MKIVRWRYDSEKNTILFSLDTGEELELPFDIFEEIVNVMPAFDEEKQIRETLREIYEVRKRRILNIEEIDTEVEKLREEHQNVRKELSAGPKKTEIFALSGRIKSLASEKTMLDTRRHLTKLLFQEEMDLRAKLAKILAGRSES